MAATLGLSVLAIVIAASLAAFLCIPAARNISRPDAFTPSPRAPKRGPRIAWGVLSATTRTLMIFLRAIPEYLWAFLLIKTLGPSAWPAAIALALHNAGILGKLQAEVLEDVAPAALRGLGAGRLQIAMAALLPATFPRFLLFFFYRFETCVREATVLGMLGVVSLGALIQNARAAQRHDEMLLFVLLGASIVVVADLVSSLARAGLRHAR